MSEYLQSIELWCDEILQTYREASDLFQDGIHREELDEWEKEFNQFQEELANNQDIEEQEAYNQANHLYTKFNHYLEQYTDEKRAEGNRERVVPIGGHTLPPLPYSYDALEPYIDRRIMELHHDKHHQSYVDGLNKAETEMQQARWDNNYDLIKHWEREAAFNGAGHYLHTIFWKVMSPDGGGEPTGDLLHEIEQSFGSYDQFKAHFTEAANHVEGGGWAILVWSPRARRLEILQAEKHQNLSQWDVVPLLVLDVWEHAYYLQYENVKEDYVDNWWNIVNWTEVENRFNKARQLKWQPF
ncbi:superoxide dismutase [Oceanobacillus jeddahense]|uniref:superoxide dismutase n=1 Tax=Oceanobacillus jeddahense TaxID=1462527 RepID=A0ABY5JX83_9BACI|nr:superoxide dismutase [Oceanobacillus jeddahense]UUI03641.1 superoxide dismutase [Oceanobacillus jeddahense]